MTRIWFLVLASIAILSSANVSASDVRENVFKALGPEHADCTVNQTFPQLELSGNCFTGEVMVGIASLNPLEVNCIQLSVNCPSQMGTSSLATNPVRLEDRPN